MSRTTATLECAAQVSAAAITMAKNTSTLWREAQASIDDGGLMVDVADPIEVIERVMRYFFSLGVHGAKNKAPVDEVQRCFNRALHAASIAAPYRHPRLTAVKHLEQGHTLDGIRSDASPEELRAEIAKRVALLRDKGYIDMNALPPPAQDAAESDSAGDECEETEAPKTHREPS
jgi:hypothetical protein